jgi:molybdopterin-guanine dinucleotide biosynthesis protein A
MRSFIAKSDRSRSAPERLDLPGSRAACCAHVPERRGAVILAGGRSERMGRPKAFLEIDGEPLLARVARIVRDACEIAVVVGTPGEPLPALPEGVRRVDDPPDRAHEGPLSGLAAGLEALNDEGVQLAYLGAVDAVFLEPAHVRWMLDTLAADRRHAAVVPESGPFDDGSRVLHPLAGAVRVPVALATVAALLRSGQRAARALYEGLGARRIGMAELPDPRALRDCDTPQDFADALAELKGR